MNQGEWLQLGIEQGWCSEPTCGTHDNTPMTEYEIEQFEDDWDPCCVIVRIWDIDVEPVSHPPVMIDE